MFLITKINRSKACNNITRKFVKLLSTTNTTTDNKQNYYDLVVVGGGIVGVATARELIMRHQGKGLKMAILEKEDVLAKHQSGHNSGVLHAGIYYTPGSLKAKLCVEGMKLAYEYFDAKKVPYKKVGKLIIATNQSEAARLDVLFERAQKNKVPDVRLITADQIKEYEPNCVGVKAIWSPHTGIVDYAIVTDFYGLDFKMAGGKILLNFKVDKFQGSDSAEYPVRIVSNSGEAVQSRYVLTCGGLYADSLAQSTGSKIRQQIVPFRGEYLILKPELSDMIRSNIYPVPDPQFPFLGVHFTPKMDGSVWVGPNAVLAFQREGYKWSDINLKELSEALRFPGFRRLAFKHLKAGVSEISRSLITQFQVQQLQKFVPSLRVEDVLPGPSGVRAQALDEMGNLVEDFCFDVAGVQADNSDSWMQRVLHCRNAPSPAATSSLAIAKMMADRAEEEFKLP